MNALDIFLLLIFSFFIVSGFSRGLVIQLVDLGGFFVALYVAATAGGRFALFLLDVFEFVPETLFPENSFLAMFIINLAGFILVYFLVRVSFQIVGKALNVATKLPVIGVLNSLGGSLVGALKGFLLLIIMVSIVSHIPSQYFQDLVRDSVISSAVFSYIPVLVDAIRDVITVETPLEI